MRVAQKNFVAAEKLIREALEAHHESGEHRASRDRLLADDAGHGADETRRFAEAEQILRETLILFSKNVRGDHQYIASAEHYLGETLLAQHKFREAEPYCSLRSSVGNAQARRRGVLRGHANALGEALEGLARKDEAEQYLVDSYRELSADPGADNDSKRLARERVTKFYTAPGQREKLNTLAETGGGSSRPPTEQYKAVDSTPAAVSRSPIIAVATRALRK